MHGHVEPDVFAGNIPFADPAQLLVVPDHYVIRMMASQGIRPAPSVCGGWTAVRSRPTPGRSGVRSAPTGSFSAVPHRVTGSNMNSSRSSASTSCRAPRPLMPSTTRSPAASPTLISVRGTARPLLYRAHLHHRPGHSDLRHHADLAAEGLGDGSFRPSGPMPSSRSTVRRGGPTSRAGAGLRGRHRRLRRLSRRPARPPGRVCGRRWTGYGPRPPRRGHHPAESHRGR